MGQKNLTPIGYIKLAYKTTKVFDKPFKKFDFWVALIVWFITMHFWLYGKWWEQALAILPVILGLSLGGFTIILSCGSDDFKEFLSTTDSDPDSSLYMSINSNFFVFTCTQIFGIILALIGNALYFPTPSFIINFFGSSLYLFSFVISILNGIGYLVFLLCFVFAFRTILRIFMISRWQTFHISNTLKSRDEEERDKEQQLTGNEDT